MKHPKSFPRWIRAGAALLVVTACLRPAAPHAQSGPAAPPAGTPAGRAAPERTLIPSLAAASRALGTAQGGAAGQPTQAFSGVLGLREAIQRGITYNLNVVGLTHAAEQARGRQRIARSALLPNLSADFSAVDQQTNLAATGVRINIPGVAFDELVRFNVVDLRARLSQTVVNLTSKNNYRAAQEAVQANELSIEDSRDLIVLAVGGGYLETLAARARLATTRAQIETATSIHERTVQQQSSGLATPLDVNRAQVQILTAQQRLAMQQADFAKRKINLARLIGLPPTDRYDLAQDVPFSPAPALSLEDTLKQAAERRSDLKAAEAQVRAAERTLDAARAERLPSVAVSADYGTNRASETSAQQTYRVAAVVRVPIWEGGRATGVIEQATAALVQRRTERDDLSAQIEGDARKAYLDLEAAATQVAAAEANLRVTRDILALTRQRFDAGVSDNIAVVQSQEALAAAEYDYINSVFAHNLAKVGLARVVGRAADEIVRYLQLP